MKSHTMLITGLAAILMFAAVSHAEIKTVVGHHRNQDAAPEFKFVNVPGPSQSDAATKATFTLVDGRRDRNGGDVDKLHDGKIPTEEDQPAHNFFFSMGADGGRILVDLGDVTAVKQVNTYSWHPATRGPQVYTLYAGEGDVNGFNSHYRISANFIHWVTETYDKDIVHKLNAAAREGKYTGDLWKTATGHTVQELGDEWKAALEKKIAAEAAKQHEK